MGTETGWLSFWRTKPDMDVESAATHEALQDGAEPVALDDLPVDEILAAMKKRYPEFDPDAEFVEIDIPKEETAIEPRWNRKHFHFTFFGDAFKQMDRVVKLMAPFGVACYDAGTQTLYPAGGPMPNFLGTPEDQAFAEALDKTFSKGAAEARAAATDPQDRLRRLKAFIDSGAAKTALEAEVKQTMARQEKKKKKK